MSLENVSKKFFFPKEAPDSQLCNVFFNRLHKLKKFFNNEENRQTCIFYSYRDLKQTFDLYDPPKVEEEEENSVKLDGSENHKNLKIFLENEMGTKMQVDENSACFKEMVENSVTGMIIQVQGRLDNETGLINVEEFFYPKVKVEKNLELKNRKGQNFLVLVSGISFGSSSTEHSAKILALEHLLTGRVKIDEKITEILKDKTLGVLFFGGVFNLEDEMENLCPENIKILPLPKFSKEKATQKNAFTFGFSNALLEKVDQFFYDVSDAHPVTVIPSTSDPSDVSLPQRPLPHVLFSKASTLNNFKMSSNPSFFKWSECVNVIVNSGEGVKDYKSFQPCLSYPDACLNLARSKCLFPTSPDTAPCKVFLSDDPLSLGEEIFENFTLLIFGNSTEKEISKRILKDEKICVVSVPSFKNSAKVFLLNLDDPEGEILTIEVKL